MTKLHYAQIIVDVPTMQTNQPYTYVVPESMIESVRPGMRVDVPFGHRHVMGFVVGLRATTELETNKLRHIKNLLDLTPVLNTELLNLSAYLAQETFAFRISVLQTMLPNALKASYERILKIIDDVDEDVRDRIFKGLDEIVYQPRELNVRDIATLTKLRREHKIEVSVNVTNRSKIKTQLAYQFNGDIAFLEDERQDLRPTAKKQFELLMFIMGHLEEVWVKKTLQEIISVSDAILNQGVEKKWLSKKKVEQLRDPFSMTDIIPTTALTLNEEQQNALHHIVASSDAQQYRPFLLEGITGSGKTEVYLQAAQHVFNQGKTVLFLVPEIALTPQMVRRVKSRFGAQTAVLHSGLSDGERYDEWRRIERGDV